MLWSWSGWYLPLADFVGQPMAVSGVEALTAGRDAVPVGCRGFRGAGCTVLLTWPCGTGDRADGTWVILERHHLCPAIAQESTSSLLCHQSAAWLLSQKSQLPPQKTQLPTPKKPSILSSQELAIGAWRWTSHQNPFWTISHCSEVCTGLTFPPHSELTRGKRDAKLG